MIDDRLAGSMSGADRGRPGAASNGPINRPAAAPVNSAQQPPPASKVARRRRRRHSPPDLPPEAAHQNHSDTGLGKPPEQAPLKCRVEKDLYLDFEEYKHYSCAICYNNMAESVFVRKLTFLRHSRIWLYDQLSGRRVLPNDTDFLLDTFKKQSTANMWLYCCQQAVDCCRKNWALYLSASSSAAATWPGLVGGSQLSAGATELLDPAHRDFCPATWDGLECWPNTPAGHILEHPCPDHVYFLSFVPVCSGSVSKQCFSNASWFIRNNHEWSNFTNCAPLPLYETRMLIGSIWNIVSALVVGPSLLIFSKLPNRGGSKRVQILQNLLLWVLIYYLFEATHKIGVITKVFRLGTEPNDLSSPGPGHRLRAHHSSLFTAAPAAAMSLGQQLQSPTRPARGQNSPGTADAGPGWPGGVTSRQKRSQLSGRLLEDLDEDRLRANKLDLDYKVQLYQQPMLELEQPCYSSSHCSQPANLDRSQVPQETSAVSRDAADQVIKFRTTPGVSPLGAAVGRSRRDLHTGNILKLADNISSIPLDSRDVQTINSTTQQQQQLQLQRLTPTPANNQRRVAPRQSTFITLACWTVSLGVRITRQLGYAWMFAGAIYLCSVLHFAPAEPPPSFIRWLMILTNVIPLTIGLVYLIIRSIYEPSPLVLLFKLPYYYAINDSATIEYLKESQADCWMFRSNHDTIEQITEFPNLILVILNSGLFIVTLTIMCRINRPGSTRQEMSLAHYFKAAGTLVLLYGAHYTLLAGLPNVDKKRSQDPNGCIKAQIGYYAFQFVDNIQGILVSYVFCYRTQEGREVISKWWSNWRSKESQWLKLGTVGCNKSARISHDYILPSSQDKKMSTKSIATEKEACLADPGTKIEMCEF